MRLIARLISHRWLWRLTLALLFVVPLLIVMPQLRYLVVRNAVVTAYFKGLRAPIGGDVMAVNIDAGENARAGQTAVQISNPRIDRGPIAQKGVLLVQIAGQIKAQRKAVAALEALVERRQTEARSYADSLAEQLELKRETLRQRAPADDAAVTEATNAVERARKLNRQGNTSKATVEAAEADYQKALATRAGNRLDLQRLDREGQDLANGIFQTENSAGGLYTQNLAQEAQLKLITERQELDRLGTLHRVTEVELAGAEEFLNKQSEASVTVPEGMTVWRTDVTVGSAVTAGTNLLSYVDCSKLLVDIAVDDATLELIRPGQAVRIRLFGRPGYIEGTVALVRGSGALEKSDDLAATVQDRGVRSGRVLATLDDPVLAQDPERVCGIGRSAYAEFEDIGVLESIFMPLLQ